MLTLFIGKNKKYKVGNPNCKTVKKIISCLCSFLGFCLNTYENKKNRNTIWNVRVKKKQFGTVNTMKEELSSFGTSALIVKCLRYLLTIPNAIDTRKF